MKLAKALESLVAADVAMVDTAPVQTAAVNEEYADEVRQTIDSQQAARQVVRNDDLEEETVRAVELAGDLDTVQRHLGEVAVDGQVSTEAYVLSLQLLRASKLGRREVAPALPALESISGSTVMVSAEGLADIMTAVGKALAKLAERYFSELVRSISFVTTRTALLRRKIKNLQDQARTMDKSLKTGSVLVKNVKMLTSDGVPQKPDQLVKYYQSSFKVLSYMIQNYENELNSAMSSNIRMADAINTTSEDAFDKTFSAFVKGFRDPRDRLGADILKFVLPGGVVLFSDGKSVYDGDDARLRRLDDISSKNLIQPILIQTAGGAIGFGKTELEGLNPIQINTVLSELDRLLQTIDKGRVIIESVMAHMRTGMAIVPGGLSGVVDSARLFSFLFTNGLVGLLRALPVTVIPGARKFPREYRLIKRALATQSRMRDHAYFDSANHAVHFGEALVRYCAASIESAKQD